MNHIEIKKIALEYPVGCDVKAAHDFILEVNTKLSELLKSEDTVNIWCRGSSGSILATILSLNIKVKECRICYVRKGNETQHSSRVYPLDEAINIVVDDFISSGETVRAIIDAMDKRPVDYLIVSLGEVPFDLVDKVKIKISA